MVIVHGQDTIPYTEIVGVDVERDVLIAKLESVDKFPSIPLGNSDNIKVGEKIYAIGSPMGLENTISEGLVSGYRTSVGELEKAFIQITASLSPGSSGGAVLNSKGELIGISNMGLRGGQNLNFAIPINEVQNVTLGSYTDKMKMDALNYFYQGKNLYEQGNNEEALTYYTKFLEVFPNDHKGYNYRGLVYVARKKYPEAIKDFSKAIQLDAKYAAAYNNRGEAYFKIEENEKAIKDFSTVIKIFPDNWDAYYARGLVYNGEEDYDEAIEDFTKVIKAHPDYTAAYINRGIAYYYSKDYERAIGDWKYSIKLDPSLQGDLTPMIDQADLLWQYNIR
jgi:regulator of sirC expression with transglutaminase-like and TPR domain